MPYWTCPISTPEQVCSGRLRITAVPKWSSTRPGTEMGWRPESGKTLLIFSLTIWTRSVQWRECRWFSTPLVEARPPRGTLSTLVRMFCDDFEVIAPGKCMSAGTLMTLGADRIVMTKQATLGPIDPTIQHALGPQILGASSDARAGVSVGAVNGYLDAVRTYSGGPSHEGKALLDLSDKVHPLVLGQIFRSRQQIRDLAHRLLEGRIDKGKVGQIVKFLCSDSGSHDYTINRREAADLGLSIEKCSESLYPILRKVTNSLSEQMELRKPFQMNSFAASTGAVDYEFTRAVIERVGHGGHHFVSVGRVETIELMNQDHPGIKQTAVQDNRVFDGWREVDGD